MQFLSGAKFNITVESQADLLIVIKTYLDLFSFNNIEDVRYILDYHEVDKCIYVKSVHKDAKIDRIDRFTYDIMAGVAWTYLQNMVDKDKPKSSDIYQGFEVTASWDKGLKIIPIKLYCGK